MQPQENQIRAILSGQSFEWAVRQLASREQLASRQYGDFVSVTVQEIERYVDTHGFDATTVVERSPGQPMPDERTVIEMDGDSWIVYYAERGKRTQLERHASREMARKAAIAHLVSAAWVNLNAWYRDRHFPGSAIPMFFDPFPPRAGDPPPHVVRFDDSAVVVRVIDPSIRRNIQAELGFSVRAATEAPTAHVEGDRARGTLFGGLRDRGLHFLEGEPGSPAEAFARLRSRGLVQGMFRSLRLLPDGTWVARHL